MANHGPTARKHPGVEATALAAALTLLIYAESAVFAVETATLPTAPPAQQGEKQRLLDSKLRLLDMLINKSPAAARIQDSGDAEAKERLDTAISAYQEARNMLQRGQLQEAEIKLDAGLAAVADASHRVVDAQREKQLAQTHYQELSRRVLSYREAFERVVMEKKNTDTSALLDHIGLQDALQQAQELAGQNRYLTANIHMARAAELLERALSAARHQETLVHELKFATPMEAYAYEKQRNKSYRLLIDMLRAQDTTPQAALALIDKFVAHNDSLQQEAEILAARGDAPAATGKLEQGTDHLIRALRVGGISLP